MTLTVGLSAVRFTAFMSPRTSRRVSRSVSDLMSMNVTLSFLSGETLSLDAVDWVRMTY